MTEDRRIMDERARLLARPLVAAVDTAGTEMLFFSLGDEQLAIEVRYVLAVAPLPEVTPVPDLPPGFLGVVNQDGGILPVVDLRVLTSGRPTDPGARILVIVGEHRRELGLAVWDAERIAAVATAHPTQDSALIRGVLDGQRVLVDGGALLRDPRLFFT
ncbi:MAG: chemotaxis protein CheW [Pseudomonadota bacterium]|nr:chemotaxis protein CheW [Pseudomonadota bacterium]